MMGEVEIIRNDQQQAAQAHAQAQAQAQQVAQAQAQQQALALCAAAEGVSGDESGAEITHNNNNANDSSFGEKKPRIPWDRNVRGDKNGLKLALLSCVLEHSFHVEGKLMENFRQVSALLSQEGSKFDKYHGIEPSGAQRKFNSIIREVAKTFKMTENGDFADEAEAEGFEALALKILKDMMVKEKAKKLTRASAKRPAESVTDEGNGVVLDHNTLTHSHAHSANGQLAHDELSVLMKRRKSDAVSLKNALRKAAESASVAEGVAGPDMGLIMPVVDEAGIVSAILPAVAPVASSSSSAAAAGVLALPKGAKIHRLDAIKHQRVVMLLAEREPPINSVGDLFAAVELTALGVNNFVTHTGVNLDKPVARVLKLYEEVASEKDFVHRMKGLTSLNAGDVLELENFLRPLYQ